MLLLYPIIVNQMKALFSLAMKSAVDFYLAIEEEGNVRTITAMMSAKNVSSFNKRKTFEISPAGLYGCRKFCRFNINLSCWAFIIHTSIIQRHLRSMIGRSTTLFFLCYSFSRRKYRLKQCGRGL